MKVTFILHGAKKKVQIFHQQMMQEHLAGYEFQFHRTASKGDAIAIAREIATPESIILVAGGDGLISECVNGIMQSGYASKTCILPVPFGSGNDFSRNFAWNNSPSNVITRIQNHNESNLDIGFVNFDIGEHRNFVNIASAGFGPAVVSIVEKFPSKWPGSLKFGMAILLGFISYRKKTIEVRSESFHWSGKAMAVAVANGKYFGSGIGIAPDAAVNDGILNVTIVGDISILDYLRQLKNLKRGIKIQHPHVFYFTTREVRIDSTSALEMDGEIGPEAHCTLSILPSAMKIR